MVKNAPAFAILGEPVTLTLRIEDQGAVPASVAGPRAVCDRHRRRQRRRASRCRSGEDIDLPLTLPHGGMNVIQFAGRRQPRARLTDRNNAAVVQINGVRDRLRVLLVSGEPHAGERTWRNLLKSDSLGRSGAFHHPAAARKAGRRAGDRAVADRVSDPRAVPRQDRRIRPDHLRPLPAARHPAVDLSRQRAQLCREGRRGAGRGGAGISPSVESALSLAPGRRSCRPRRPAG